MKVKSESKVAQSCPTLLDPMDCSPPGSPVHGLFQAIVEAASKQKDVQVPVNFKYSYNPNKVHNKINVLEKFRHTTPSSINVYNSKNSNILIDE